MISAESKSPLWPVVRPRAVAISSPGKAPVANAAKVNAGLAMRSAYERVSGGQRCHARFAQLGGTNVALIHALTPSDVFDRDSAGRTNEAIWAEVDAHPDAIALIAKRGSVAAADQLLFVPVAHAADGERTYLGRAQTVDGVPAGAPIELRIVDGDEPPAGANWVGLRDVIRALSADQVELAATAIAIANWRASHQFCPKCGSALRSEQAGWALSCTDCASQVFPRTDPAVIVRVTDDADRLLLGSNAAWEANRYSLLAGFVEPGESAEAAVIREVFEESGVRVVEPQFVASQAWPMPASLMLGFSARAVSAELVPDGEEILDLRWFDRETILDSGILLPRRGSLARAIVEDWFGSALPDANVS